MSESHEPKPLFERYWQPLLITLGVIGVALLAFYNPTA